MGKTLCIACTSAFLITLAAAHAQVGAPVINIEQSEVLQETETPRPTVEIPEIDFREPFVEKEIDETKQPDIPVITEQSTEGADTDETSHFQKYLMRQIPLSISRRVGHFGYNFFRQPPSAFAPVTAVPVTAGYVIGPGDEIRINVWGMLEGRWNLVVDRDGNINIPTAGIVSVAGLTYENLELFLKKELSKHYKEFYLNVSMGRLRTIPVYLVGSVKKPGNYTVSSLSTLVNALFVSGGPAVSGTMRSIQLKRRGETVVEFDMYDFLLKGDKTKDVRLQPEDVIFVPAAGALAAIIGHVKNPAIYELKGTTTLKGLIEMSGGISATGYTKKIQVERIFENKTKVLIDKNVSELTDEDDMELADGDIVAIYPISDAIINAVTLQGNVVRPGQYQWKEGIRISDLIKSEQELLPETNLEYALIERLQSPSLNRELLFFNLGKAVIEKDTAEDKLLHVYDIIKVFSLWEFREKPAVRIAGTVNRPGTYLYRENMTVADLIKLAGGPKYFAYTQEAELTRVYPASAGPETQRIRINIEKAMQGDSEHNILLERNDYLFIRPVPDWQVYETVRINGEVKFPGTYTINKGETITSLIARAGGFTNEAYVRGAVFTRESVKRSQREQMDKMIDRIEMELLSPRPLPVESTAADIKAQESDMQRKRELIARLKSVKPDGRVVISLADAPVKKIYDLKLEQGDTVTVPKNPGIVTVMGAVYNPTSFVYDGRFGYDRYIQMAGGFTPTAEKRAVYIIKADGTVVRIGAKHSLEPGDAVVAPEKIEIVSVRREIRDIIDVLYKTAITVAVTTTIF